MMLRNWMAAAMVSVMAVSPAAAAAVGAATLRGSHGSMERQHEVAKELNFTFSRTPAQLRELVVQGKLVEVTGNADFQVSRGVGYAVTRPEVRTFIERFAAGYHAGCGEPLVITSLTRPISQQPRNASPLSVHPAGMAVDFRVSRQLACRAWLEHKLLALEGQSVLDVTREMHPSHYHVAVFPAAYMAYESTQPPLPAAAATVATVEPSEPDAAPAAQPATPDPTRRQAVSRRGTDGLAPFAIAVILSVALVWTLAWTQRNHRGPTSY
jgi:hypothetical protein